jgi:hypothetical protein
MVKDEWEIEQMRAAIAATQVGFEAVIADLRAAVERGRGERWVEGTFGLHARHQGNGVGYDSICAAGDHANTLHWIKNTGEIRAGDMILLDAGRRGRQPLHRRHHPHPARRRHLHRRATRDLRRRVCRPASRHRRHQAGREVLRHPRGRDPGHRRASARVGAAARGRSTSRTP